MAAHPLRDAVLQRNGETVRRPMPGVEAVPSTRIPGGACPAHCGYPPLLVKAGLPELGTEAASQGGSLTAPWYRSALTASTHVCLPGRTVSSAESGQVKLATVSSKATNSSQAYPRKADWVLDRIESTTRNLCLAWAPGPAYLCSHYIIESRFVLLS